MQKSVTHLAQKQDLMRGSNAATDLYLRSVSEDTLGQTDVRWAQYHNDLEVFGGQIITHLSQREELFVSGRLFAVNEVEPTPSIAAEQAIQFAKDTLAYARDFATEPTAKLVVLPNSYLKDDEAAGPTLTWQVELRIQDGTDATANHQYFINAIDGQVVWHFDSLPKNGIWQSLYHGQVPVTSTKVEDQFKLGFYAVTILNLKNGTDFSTAMARPTLL